MKLISEGPPSYRSSASLRCTEALLGQPGHFGHHVLRSRPYAERLNDPCTVPRSEKIAQAIAAMQWGILCERSDVDISREPNFGRGPVDFKFSAGWTRRAVIEMKLMSNPKLRQGAVAQLPEYMNSERVSSAYYVCIGFRDHELSETRKQLVRDACKAHEQQTGYTVTPTFVDARPKKSASKLT